MNIFVSGGTRGIGKAIVERFAKEGHRIIFTYKNSVEVAKTIEALYSDAHGYQCDSGNYLNCLETAKDIFDKYGIMDVIINNAGITRDKSFHKMTVEQWEEVIQINLLSVFYFTQYFYSKMMEKRIGHIINIASVVGQKGAFGQTNYAASKAGIIGFTKALAIEAASKNITVNAIAPGYTKTDMVSNMPEDVINRICESIPLKRLGQSEEIAEIAYFLTTDACKSITGQVICPNGGYYM